MVIFVSRLISKLSYVSDEIEIFKYIAFKELVQFIHTVASEWQFLLGRLGQFLKQGRG